MGKLARRRGDPLQAGAPRTRGVRASSSATRRTGRDLLAELGGFAARSSTSSSTTTSGSTAAATHAGSTAPQIGLATRVLTVCDVYDALVSAASTGRPGPSHMRWACCAMKRGSAFDPICVAALERVLTRNQDDPGWVTEFALSPRRRAHPPRGADQSRAESPPAARRRPSRCASSPAPESAARARDEARALDQLVGWM